MDISSAYSDWSTTYDQDRNLTRDLDAEVTRTVLGDRQYSCILESGCGTGKNTLFLATLGESVEALDFSEGMLEQARAKVQAAGLSNIRFTLTDLTRPWPRQTASADLVVCNLVLEHIADLGAVFAESARVLRPGGQFFLCELHPFKQYLGAKATFQRGEETTRIPAFVHHLSDYFRAARESGLAVEAVEEWWHPEDREEGNTPPRLVSFLFQKPL